MSPVGSRATRTLLISENRSGARPPTDVRIADHPAGVSAATNYAKQAAKDQCA